VKKEEGEEEEEEDKNKKKMMTMMMMMICIRSSCSVYVPDAMIKKFHLGERTGVNDSGKNFESGTVEYDTVGGYQSFRGTCSPLMWCMNEEKQQVPRKHL
jgi:hypothetical protein